MNKTKVRSAFDAFVKSNWFIVAAATVVFVGWVSGQWPVFLCLLAVLCTLPLFLTDSNRSLLVFFLQFTFIIGQERQELNAYWWLLLLLIPLLGGVVFQTVRYRKTYDWRALSPKRIKGQHAWLLLFVLPFALGGATRTHEKPVVVAMAFVIFLLIGVVYSYFVAGNTGREDKRDLPTWVLNNLLAVGVVLSLEVLVYYLQLGSPGAILNAIRYKLHALGWGGANNIGTIYTITIPVTFYYCTRKSRLTPLFALLALLELALLVSTGSRGSTFAVVLALPAIMLYVMAVTPAKRAFGVTSVAGIMLGMAALLVVAAKVLPMLADRFGMGFDDNGRMDFEYPAAIEGFKTYPVFGAGWDYLMGTKIDNGYTPLWFHSTVLQVMATMGGFGLAVYAVWFVQRYRTFYLMRGDRRAVFLGIATVLFEAYCMVDTGFFAPSFFIMILIMQFACEINIPEGEGYALPRRWRQPKPVEPEDLTE